MPRHSGVILAQDQQASLNYRPPSHSFHAALRRRKIEKGEFTNLHGTRHAFSTLVYHYSTLVNTVKAPVKPDGTSELKHEVELINEPLKLIVNETLSSEHLPTRTCATYVRYIGFAKLWVNNSALLPLVKRLINEGRKGKTMDISSFYS